MLQASGPVIDRSFAGFHFCEKRKAQPVCRNNQSLDHLDPSSLDLQPKKSKLLADMSLPFLKFGRSY